jgi:ABC-type lipoprotein release transport system permease subunit
MFLFAVMSAVGAAFLASKKISEVTPSEVLRYE